MLYIPSFILDSLMDSYYLIDYLIKIEFRQFSLIHLIRKYFVQINLRIKVLHIKLNKIYLMTDITNLCLMYTLHLCKKISHISCGILIYHGCVSIKKLYKREIRKWLCLFSILSSLYTTSLASTHKLIHFFPSKVAVFKNGKINYF